MTNMISACVTSIFISPVAGSLPESVQAVRAIAGAGLEGDRYCSGEGTWSHWPGGGRQVTLIESEVVAALEQSLGDLSPGSPRLSAAQTRRNIITRGVRLNDWVGLEFTVGEVVMRGVRLCEPCAHLEKLTARGVASALTNCGGLRADIVHGGMIHPGDKLALQVSR